MDPNKREKLEDVKPEMIKADLTGIARSKDVSLLIKSEPTDIEAEAFELEQIPVKKEAADIDEIKCELLEDNSFEHSELVNHVKLEDMYIDIEEVRVIKTETLECDNEQETMEEQADQNINGGDFEKRDGDVGDADCLAGKGNTSPSKDSVLRCSKCNYKTDNRSRFNHHQLVHLPRDEWLKCDQCKFQTKYRKSHAEHMLMHRVHEGTASGVEMLKCEMCDYQNLKKKNVVRHMATHGERMFSCKQCSYKGKLKYELTRHMLVHVPEAEWLKCTECSFQTKYKESYDYHMLVHRAGNDGITAEVFKCSSCDYTNLKKRNVTRHMAVHSDKMFSCTQCDYKARSTTKLSHHMISHLDEKEGQWHKCDKCTFQARTRRPLLRHAIVHKDIGEVQSYCCDECGFQTKYKTRLQTHITKKHPRSRQTASCTVVITASTNPKGDSSSDVTS